MGEVVRFLEQLPSNWEEIRHQIAGMQDIREIVAAKKRAKALGEVIAAERETNEDAFGLAICALDLMARAGEVIEDMQSKGELATQNSGRPKKASQRATLMDFLGAGARDKASRSARP